MAGGRIFRRRTGAARHIGGVRETNHRSVLGWLHSIEADQSPVAEQENLPADDKARELLVFALRRLEGITRDWFVAKTGLTVDALVGEPLQRFVAVGLLIDDGQRIRLCARDFSSAIRFGRIFSSSGVSPRRDASFHHGESAIGETRLLLAAPQLHIAPIRKVEMLAFVAWPAND